MRLVIFLIAFQYYFIKTHAFTNLHSRSNHDLSTSFSKQSKQIIQKITKIPSSKKLFSTENNDDISTTDNISSLSSLENLPFSPNLEENKDEPTPQSSSSSSSSLGAWIPLGSASALVGLGPLQITVMGINLVVWHNEPILSNVGKTTKKKIWKRRKKKVTLDPKALQWSAQVDVCSHRLAPLSQGRVDPETGCIECPYHGWQFDSKGCVQKIPQLEKSHNVENVGKSGGNIQSFPIHLAGDLIFVFLPSSIHGESFPINLLPEDMYPFLRSDMDNDATYFTRDLPYSFDFLLENFLDPAHIPYAHHSLQSVRDDGSPISMEEMASNFTHVQLSFKDISRGKPRDAYMVFQRPSFYYYSAHKGKMNESTGDKEYEPNLKLYIVPVKAGKSRVMITAPTNQLPKIFKSKHLTFLLHAASNRFLNTDTWLHDAERTAAARKNTTGSKKLANLDYVLASRSDLGTTSFRKWWLKYGFAKSPPNTFGMSTIEQLGMHSLSRKQQIDPWENHSKHCSHCIDSLTKLKSGQKICVLLAFCSSILFRKSPPLAISVAVLAMFGYQTLGKLRTVIEGNPHASEIGYRSVSANAD